VRRLSTRTARFSLAAVALVLLGAYLLVDQSRIGSFLRSAHEDKPVQAPRLGLTEVEREVVESH